MIRKKTRVSEGGMRKGEHCEGKGSQNGKEA